VAVANRSIGITVDDWLRSALADADRRQLPELEPLLESFARSLARLRAADFNQRADLDSAHANSPASPRAGNAERKTSDFGLQTSDLQDAGSLTIERFAAQLRRREITSAEITERCLQRIDALDGRLNAFILVTADEARVQARAADDEIHRGTDRGPLHGVPISVKDLLDVRGTPTTAASRVREGHIADRDARLVSRLRRAGAVIIGKTNLHEFAFGTTSEESAFGAVRNPHDAGRSAGGSSGGSAVSVATGMCLASIGTDTGGSIRIPSAACGVVGLKPRFNEIDTDGVVPLAGSLDHAGPLACTVADARLIYRALREVPDREETLSAASDERGEIALGALSDYFCELLDPEVRSAFESAVGRLRTARARVAGVQISHARDIAPVYMTIVYSEAAAYHAATLDRMADRYSPPVRMRLELGRYLPAEDLARALRGREVLRQEVETALAQFDALVLPTLPIPAPELGAQTVQIGASSEPVRSLMLRNTQLFNLSGHPAISLPCGRTRAGLPCGLQLVGRTTDGLLRTAAFVERVLSAVSPEP
jgi:aspartyl-tRNA(Asn)/glutamyl-tRNA(Gln) amidotransferase subunit A